MLKKCYFVLVFMLWIGFLCGSYRGIIGCLVDIDVFDVDFFLVLLY